MMNCSCSMTAVVSVLGFLVLARFISDLCVGFYSKFLRAAKDLKKYGKWAVVTGATDGIGKAITLELARKGLNLLIISRTEAKLVEMQKELKEKYPVDVIYVAADLGAITSDVKDRLQKAVTGIEVGVLVNNVGISYPYPKYFHEITEENLEALVNLNVVATNVMTRLVLPGMLERKKGVVVNMSSIAGEMTNPLLAAYCGTKAGVTMQTRSLAAEYSSKGIDFQVQIPLFISTKLAKQRASFTVPTPEAYAKVAVPAFGYETVCSPFWVHAVMTYILQSLPESVVIPQILSMHLGLRKRGMNKDAKKQ